MYFIHNIFTFVTESGEFNLKEELRSIPRLAMVNHKYYIVNNKLLLVDLTSTHVVLVYFNIETGKIITTSNNKFIINDICVARSTINLTLEDIVLTIFTRLSTAPIIVSISLCCLSRVLRNKLTKQRDIIVAESIALSGGSLAGSIVFRGEDYKKVLVGKCGLEFLKLYDKIYLFSVNGINMIIKCIIYFDYKNNGVKFGMRTGETDHYYECSSFNFTQLLLKLYGGKVVAMGDEYQLISTHDVLYDAIEVAN